MVVGKNTEYFPPKFCYDEMEPSCLLMSLSPSANTSLPSFNICVGNCHRTYRPNQYFNSFWIWTNRNTTSLDWLWNRGRVTSLKTLVYSVSLNAKHVQKKATKKHIDRRPKKSRRSDRIRKPTDYPAVEWCPPEFTISDEPASPVTRKSEE